MLELYLAAVGALAVAMGLASRPLRDAPVTEPLLALLVGIVLGPAVLGLAELDEAAQPQVLAVSASLVLAISVMAVALRYSIEEIRPVVGAAALLVTVGMAAMAAVSTLLSVVVLGLPIAGAWFLGAALAPTDPVLASNVVSGGPAERHLPLRVRVLLSIESAANDGLAFALVAIGVAALVGRGLLGEAGSAVVELAIAVVVGGILGWGVGRLVVVSERHRDMEHSAFLALTLSLAFLVLGATHILGGQEIVAVFVAGLAYNDGITAADRREEWEVQEAVNRYLVLPVFTLFGVALPWDAWTDLGWRGPAFAVTILVARRVPVVLLLRPLVAVSRAEAVFLGWFGPIGVAALYYLATTVEHGAAGEELWAAGTLVVAASTVVHGVTAAPGRRRLAEAEGVGRGD